MKLFIVIIIVLAYWPMVVGRSLRGRRALAPIYDFSTNPCSISDAFNMGRAGVQGVSTLPLRIADHNKAAGQSAAVSIWTGFQVTSDCVLTAIGLPSINLTHRQLQARWSYVLHWWRIGAALLLGAVINIAVYLLFVFSIALLLLSKPTAKCHGPIAPPPSKPTFVSTVTRIPGPSGLGVHELVGKKQLSINFFELQGRLVLSSGPTSSDSPAEWTVLFHSHGTYHPACHPVNHKTQLDLAHERLLHLLLRGVSAYHPWTRYLPGIVIRLPREPVKEVHAGRKPSLVAKIAEVGDTPKRTVNDQTVERPVVVKRPTRKLTFASSIDRIGGPQKPAAYHPVLPMRPPNPPAWIEKFTPEGRLVVYSGRHMVGRPVQWRVLFDPRTNYHLTQYGDESSNLQRDMVDGYLLHVLLEGFSVYHPCSLYLSTIVLEVPGEIVNEPSHSTVTQDLLEITTNGLPPSDNQAVPKTIHCSASSVLPTSPPAGLGANIEHEVRDVLDESEYRSPLGSASEQVPANAENDVECYEEPHHPIDAHGPGQVDIGPYTPNLEALLIDRHIDVLYSNPYPQPVAQRETVHQEMQWSVPAFEERARQLHAHRTGGTQATDGAIAAEDRMDEEVQQQGLPKRVKRRGGKKNALWKRKCLQRRDEREHNPEAGPSGLQ